MKVGYTEFSFGYAFTENLIRSHAHGPANAPRFPNLNQEATLGYDVRIDLPGCPFFFQYKLPELMKRATAIEISRHRIADLEIPFFRMTLMRRDHSDQHALLVDLQRTFRNSVYYATPCLENEAAFNAAYATAVVHDSSALFLPIDIGPLPDDESHVIAYNDDAEHGWFCSQPRKIPLFRIKNLEDKAKHMFDDERFRHLETMISAVGESLFSLIPDALQQAVDQIRTRVRARRVAQSGEPPADEQAFKTVDEILTLREVARIGLGLDMVIAQPRARRP